jgi:hypothetical protein
MNKKNTTKILGIVSSIAVLGFFVEKRRENRNEQITDYTKYQEINGIYHNKIYDNGKVLWIYGKFILFEDNTIGFKFMYYRLSNSNIVNSINNHIIEKVDIKKESNVSSNLTNSLFGSLFYYNLSGDKHADLDEIFYGTIVGTLLQKPDNKIVVHNIPNTDKKIEGNEFGKIINDKEGNNFSLVIDKLEDQKLHKKKDNDLIKNLNNEKKKNTNFNGILIKNNSGNHINNVEATLLINNNDNDNDTHYIYKILGSLLCLDQKIYYRAYKIKKNNSEEWNDCHFIFEDLPKVLISKNKNFFKNIIGGMAFDQVGSAITNNEDDPIASALAGVIIANTSENYIYSISTGNNIIQTKISFITDLFIKNE